MARGDKTLASMRENPRDWRMVAATSGVNVRKSGGSHVVFEYPDSQKALSVPAPRPIKPIYVQRFARFIDAVREANDRD